MTVAKKLLKKGTRIMDKKGKYGRYLTEVWLKNENGEWSNINDLLVKSGYAVYKEY